jgi:hypothetical protein
MKCLPLILLVAAQAQAAELQALILTGAASEAAAAPLLEAAKKRVEEAKDLLELPPGFPKLVQSDKVTGLKPGFWIVLAGYCEKDTVLAALKALDSGAYSRPVTVDAAACPKVADKWDVTTEEAKDSATRRLLRGVLFTPTGDNGANWKMYVSLKEKSGALVAEKILEQTNDSSCMSGGETELKVKGAALVLKVTDCLKPRGCPNPAAVTLTVTVSAADQTIGAEEKILKDPGYRGCSGE